MLGLYPPKPSPFNHHRNHVNGATSLDSPLKRQNGMKPYGMSDSNNHILLAIRPFIKYATDTLSSPVIMGDKWAKSLTYIVSGCNDYVDILGNQDQRITSDLMAIKNNAIQYFNQLIEVKLNKNPTFGELLHLKDCCKSLVQILDNQHPLTLETLKKVTQQINRVSVSGYLSFETCEKERCLLA